MMTRMMQTNIRLECDLLQGVHPMAAASRETTHLVVSDPRAVSVHQRMTCRIAPGVGLFPEVVCVGVGAETRLHLTYHQNLWHVANNANMNYLANQGASAVHVRVPTNWHTPLDVPRLHRLKGLRSLSSVQPVIHGEIFSAVLRRKTITKTRTMIIWWIFVTPKANSS